MIFYRTLVKMSFKFMKIYLITQIQSSDDSGRGCCRFPASVIIPLTRPRIVTVSIR